VTKGPLILTVIEMFSRDIIPFLIIYFCFFATVQTSIMGFSGAMHASKDTASVYLQWLTLVRFTINPDTQQFEDLQGTHWSDATSEDGNMPVVVMIWIAETLWVLLSNIVLLNLLIAMMGNTYGVVLEKSEQMWRLKFNELLLFLEASPKAFIPTWVGDRRKRPKMSHFEGPITLPKNGNGPPHDTKCWWLQLTIPFKIGPDRDETEQKLDELEEKLNTRMDAVKGSIEGKIDELKNAINQATVAKVANKWRDNMMRRGGAGSDGAPAAAGLPKSSSWPGNPLKKPTDNERKNLSC